MSVKRVLDLASLPFLLSLFACQACSSLQLNNADAPRRLDVFAEEIILAPLMADTCLIYAHAYGEEAASRIEIVTRTRNEIDGEIVNILIDGTCMKPLVEKGLSDLGPPERVEVFSSSGDLDELMEDTCAVYEAGYGQDALRDVIFVLRHYRPGKEGSSAEATDVGNSRMEAKCPPYRLQEPAVPGLSRGPTSA